MKAVGFTENLPITDPRALADFETSKPAPGPHDLLVRIQAISVNPIDTKVRKRRAAEAGTPVILGWDASGIVEAVGDRVTLFAPGDEVYYAGALMRPGSNAEYNLVDERIAGHKPSSLSFSDAAALPLTTITAWECLFDRLGVPVGKAPNEDAILIIGAAGGVGSIAVQLARRLTNLFVVGTASRAESQAWVRTLGAHAAIDHSAPFAPQLAALNRPSVRYVLSLTHTDQHWNEIIQVLAPQGEICMTDDPGPAVDLVKLKGKAGALHIEMMFARSTHQTPDMIQHHRLLEEVARLVDDGLVKTTTGQHYGRIDAANLRRAHETIESNRAIGKIVLEGF